MIIDKFAYHQPLYRQHVKLQDSGINVSRAWITKLMPAAVSLIEPIFNAQLESARRSRLIAMDETPIKAGRAGPGKMKAAYFWPVVGEQDEICFLYYPSRAIKHVETTLGLQRPHGAVLQSDGYSAYEHHATKTGITHAQCWAHARRKIFDARDIEPAQADQALHAIAALYKVEQQIRDGALAYIRERRVGLSVYLDDPEVSIDTNHRERAQLAVQLDRAGRQTYRHCAKPAGDLPAARYQSVRLLRGRSAACRSASGVTRASAHATNLEGDVCRQSATVGPSRHRQQMCLRCGVNAYACPVLAMCEFILQCHSGRLTLFLPGAYALT